MLVKALANEAKCNFYFKSGGEFDEIYVGVGAKWVKEIFDKARNNQPAIIFIDEFDALAGKRVMDHSVYRGALN